MIFKRERDIYLTVLCVCVCVYAFVWACKRETERDSKKRIKSIFKREREKKEKSFNSIFDYLFYVYDYELLKEREKKPISLHWKNLLPYFVKTYFPITTSIQQMALNWNILNFFKFSFIKHTVLWKKLSLKCKPFSKYLNT